jgi:hypothetical protein
VKLRTPFPDVEERDPEALGVSLVDVPAREPAVAPAARGLREHTGENRRQRRKGVATWQPPVQEAQGFEVKDVSGEYMSTLHLGMVVNASNGERAKVVMLDRERGVVRYEFVQEPIPGRRELLQQRKRRARGTLDVKLRRLQRAALRKD